MLLVLQKSVFIKNEAAQQCVTMRKHFSTIMATTWYKSFSQKFVLLKIEMCDPPSKCGNSEK